MLHVGSAVAVLLGSSRWFKMQMDKAMHWGEREGGGGHLCGFCAGACAAGVFWG